MGRSCWIGGPSRTPASHRTLKRSLSYFPTPGVVRQQVEPTGGVKLRPDVKRPGQAEHTCGDPHVSQANSSWACLGVLAPSGGAGGVVSVHSSLVFGPFGVLRAQ